MNTDNKIKNISGRNARLLVADMLDDVRNIDLFNIEYSEKYAIGYPGKDKQFKMDFIIKFPDCNNESWLIKSTNSIRERIYGTEFFAQNIRIVDENVTKIYVVVPDSISNVEIGNKQNYSNKIKSEKYVSFITDVITVNELRNLIISKASKNISQGMRANILGADAETKIVELLKDENNIALWNDYKNANQTIKSSTYHIFKKVLKVIGLKESENFVESISATNDIPRLSNNGKPKTDIAFEIVTDSGTFMHTISIKNSVEKNVTVHEGYVADLILALGLDENNLLSQALVRFQDIGSEKNLKESCPEVCDLLKSELSKYNKELVEFFVFGVNSPLVNDDIQIADMILFTNKFDVWSREDYIEHYISNFSEKGQFGTPFKFTYPSGKRGRKIQVKGFTNN